MKQLNDLVARFAEHADAYRAGRYNETQLRRDFLDPFFALLGWDVHNEHGYAEAYREVIHEDKLKIGGATKAPDYGFRIGGRRKFFVEAKKPSVDIKGDPHPAYQLRRYAWSAKLPLSILTDFEELAVYDCTVQPKETDKASTARVMYVDYDDYEENWEELASIFSKEAILKGSFDKYAASATKKRGTAEVDKAFLEEIEQWRDLLARNIALRNAPSPTRSGNALDQRALNFAVQRTIDRIVFLRICEDRGIEDYGTLRQLMNGEHVYRRLFERFRRADERYNSGLFHFSEEKGDPERSRRGPDTLTPDLAIDDKVLKNILGRLYYPESPYEFSVLPADVLGQVYEQFLGRVIRLTPGHRAKVEEKPEVRKAGGVYYTPTYIVDYIVEHTIGKLLDGKTPQEAAGLTDAWNTSKTREPIRVLDPACGSGSFLLGAYQVLLDWYRDRYVEDGPEEHTAGKEPRLVRHGENDWRLTTAERKRILLAHIYGVDIDRQAVEVTKLSLLLKVLEGESEQSLQQQLRLFQERALPDLAENIKCGNSLIGSDFYDNQQASLLDDEELYRVNAFDWKTEFADIFKDGGPDAAKRSDLSRRSETKPEAGFDAVIGNPPYVRQETLGAEQKGYFKTHFEVYAGTADLYAYFIERGMTLLRPGGVFGYIVANKWMRANYGKALRQFVADQTKILQLIDFGELPVFQDASTFPMVLLLQNEGIKEQSFLHAPIKTLDFQSLKKKVDEVGEVLGNSAIARGSWTLVSRDEVALLDKVRTTSIPLEEYLDGEIHYGIKTGLNKAFVIDAEMRENLIQEDPRSAEVIKSFLRGRDLKRFRQPKTDKFLIFTRRGIEIDAYPAIKKHLLDYKESLTPKPRDWPRGQKWPGRKPGAYEWYEIQDTVAYYEEFEKPKIVYPDIAKESRFTFDANGHYLVNTIYFIPSNDLFLLAILNSRLIFHYFKRNTAVLGDADKRGRLRFFEQDVLKLPIPRTDPENTEDASRHAQMVDLVETMLDLNKRLAEAQTSHNKTLLERRIAATDRRIDRLVYELYGLTEEEVGIVEGAHRP